MWRFLRSALSSGALDNDREQDMPNATTAAFMRAWRHPLLSLLSLRRRLSRDPLAQLVETAKRLQYGAGWDHPVDDDDPRR